MVNRLWAALAVVALGLCLPLVYAQDKLVSGPQVGTDVPGPFHPLNVTGEAAGKKKCLYCAYGEAPVAVVFARDLTPQVASLIKQIDATTVKNKGKDMGSFAVFCSDDEKLEAKLKEFAAKYNRPARAFSQRAHARMFEYHWPGNVRELQNTIERAVLMCKGDTIQETNLPQPKTNTATAAISGYTPPKLAGPAAAALPPDTFAPPLNLPKSVSLEELGNLIVNRINEPQPGQTPEDLFNQLEKIIVRATLQRTKGNKQAAANLLGLYRPRLYGMIKRHELE